jgi:16S rRNA (uracil1498-N3)-methyltransferase
MTRRRWIADEVSGNHASLTGDHADHLSRVLRARVGQEFDIVAEGKVRRGKITEITDARVDLTLGEELPPTTLPKITLLLAIFKFDRLEWAIEKCTELGVAKIIPVIAARTDTHLAATAAKRAERWRRIAQQAAEQSRREAPPEIAEPTKLKDALATPGKVHIVLSESEPQQAISDILTLDSEDVVLAIGPEGGWTPAELDLLQSKGWKAATLGQTILRAETAAIAATAITMSVLVSKA